MKGYEGMIIYEFNTWFDFKNNNGLFGVTEIEVEEKPNSYIGKGIMVLKDDIDKLNLDLGIRMYRLSNDSNPYILAVINHLTERVEIRERYLKLTKKKLAKWEALLIKADHPTEKGGGE